MGLAAVLLLLASLLACCTNHGSGVITIPAYDTHPQTTESLSHGTPTFCRTDARLFARAALLFVNHSDPSAAYPADLYYLDLRDIWTDFLAHRCAPSYLGPALVRWLTQRKLYALTIDLPKVIASTVQAGLIGQQKTAQPRG